MDSKKPIYKPKAFWVLGLFLLYSALGFFAVPYFIKQEIKTTITDDLNSSINLDKVSFNPFTLATTLSKVELTDTDKQLWFSADEVMVNFSLIETLFGNTKLSEIKLDNPHYYLLLTDNKEFPIRYPQIKASESSLQEPLVLDIDSVIINQGSVSYLDKSSDNSVDLKFKSVGLKHIDFSTDDKHSQFDLSLITEHDDKIDLIGHFNFAQLIVKGNWTIQQFSTHTLFKFITDENNQFYGFENQSGSMDAKGKFDYDFNNQTLPNLTIENLQLSDFKTRDSGLDQPELSIPSFLINDAELNLNEKQISIKSILAEDINVTAFFHDDKQLIWSELSANSKEALENKDEVDQNWLITIDKIVGERTQLNLKKHKNDKIIENKLFLTSTVVSNLTNIPEQTTNIDLSVVLDDSGKIDMSSTLQYEPFNVQSKFKADSVNLKSTQAWIPNDVKLVIESGQLSLEQSFSFENNQYQSRGWGKLNTLNLLDENNQTFLKVSQLDITENEIDSTTQTININNIKLDRAEGNLIVSTNSELNINGIISDQQDKQKIKDNIKNTKDDWIINIKQVKLLDLQTSFIDRSIKPSYQSNITKVNGTIKALSSSNTSKADVDLTGILDTYGKFDIKGKINPLSDKAYTDLDINLTNLDLQNFSTYTSKYIGFPINRGKADFLLKYKLNQSLLKGINDLEFKQLQLGSKIASEETINLPLKLAISLLTNSKGIMNIDLPVSGRVDDPNFSYGGLVFKAFFKLITGIVASPFKLLGKLIPGGTDLDMSGIQFQAGTVDLKSGEKEKLKAMQSILKKRPALILELSSTINTIEDNKALKQILLLDQMKITEVPDFTSIESLKPLKKAYKNLRGIQHWQTLESNSHKEGILDHEQLAENAWKEMLKTFSQESKNQLEIIGKQRSQKILQLLIEDYKIPEKSIFLKPIENSEGLTPQVKFGIAN